MYKICKLLEYVFLHWLTYLYLVYCSMKNFKLWINGNEHCFEAPTLKHTLIHYLRSTGLTGTKLSCGEGSCGCCTVLVSKFLDDRVEEVTMTSCTVPLISLHGCHVTTIEGIGSTRHGLHPIQVVKN